jgi:hypothetical protein
LPASCWLCCTSQASPACSSRCRVLWQQGLGRSALDAGLLMLPFALGSLCTAASSDWFSARFGRTTIMTGITAKLAGLGGALLAVHLGGPRGCWQARSRWRAWATGW